MTDHEEPTAQNRLDEEESPYLRQHADNPVNWQAWDDEALAAARERDVPIFLSIGYSACHWCHVMEEESFQNDAVAEILNEKFVPIKVDREERPDVDSIYMTICQRVTGRGGWPLSAWLTPEGKPFYVGTYFPLESKRGQPGFRDLLGDIADSWADPEDRAEMESRAEQWTSAIEGSLEETPDQPGGDPDEQVFESAASAVLRGADREHGGWGRGQKFPQSGRIELLARAYDDTGRDTYREVLVETLDAMADGGLYDHVGGGFHRYTTDREWVVPHFEKMLYDNAELPRVFLLGYQLTGEERYRRVAAETFEFIRRELTHEEGGFFSTLDARSEGEEGKFYVWTPAQVREAVADETDAELFCDRFGVTEQGNFEGGSTVLTLAASVGELAAEYDLAETDVTERLETAREQVFDHRAGRVRPARDEKVLASWNGLAIRALAQGDLVLDGDYAEMASDALAFCRERLWDGDESRLARRFKDDDVAVDGYLEDYAFLARGAFALYGVTGDVDALSFALELARAIEREFWDAEAGTLYFTPESGESLVARPQELTDQSTPSSAGVAAALLLDLDAFVTHDRFGDVATAVLRTHGDRLRSDPVKHPSLVLATDRYISGASELTMAADEVPASWRERLAESYVPRRLLAPRPPTTEGLAAWIDAIECDGEPPVWAERGQRDGEPTVYACQSFSCSPPRHDLDVALSWLEDGSTD